MMFEYLVINQQVPAQQPQPAQPAQQPVAPQQPAQPVAGAPPPQTAPGAQPAAQPPGAVPAGAPVSMVTMLQWAGIGGAASGAIQAAFSVVSGFDVVNFLMTVGIAVVIGVLVAIILGQFGKKIPIKASLMVKAAAFMFVINLIAGFILGMGAGTLGMILGIVSIGAGAFAYGWLIQNKLPNLV